MVEVVSVMLDASRSKPYADMNPDVAIGFGDAVADVAAVVTAYLLREATELHALVKSRVWVDRVPQTVDYRNTEPGVLFRLDGGVGRRTHQPDGITRVAFWAYGGVREYVGANWTPPAPGAADEHPSIDAGEVNDALTLHLWAANVAQTDYGVLVAANNVVGPQQIREPEHEWSLYHSVWEIETRRY